jgi:hypothetical protein
MATKAFPYGDYPEQVKQTTPYAGAYAGVPSQVADEQRRVDAERMQRDKMYSDLRDQGHTNDSARIMVDSYYAKNKTPIEEQNERNALAINFVREGHDPMMAQQLANQTYGMQKQSMQLKNQWTALSMQQAQQDLADKQRQLNEASRLTQMKAELGALNHNDLTSSKKIEDITSRFSDVIASPRREIKDEATGLLNNSWAATGDAQKLFYTEAEKDGIPVKQLGGIPQEALNEQGVYDSEKGRSFAEKYHEQQLELSKKAEQQKADVVLGRQKAFDLEKRKNELMFKLSNPDAINEEMLKRANALKQMQQLQRETTVGAKNAYLLEQGPIGEGDATGRIMKGGDYLIYKNEKGKKIAIKKDKIQKLQQQNEAINNQLQNIEEDTRNAITKELNDLSEKDTTKQNQTLVFDPSTGTFSPK